MNLTLCVSMKLADEKVMLLNLNDDTLKKCDPTHDCFSTFNKEVVLQLLKCHVTPQGRVVQLRDNVASRDGDSSRSEGDCPPCPVTSPARGAVGKAPGKRGQGQKSFGNDTLFLPQVEICAMSFILVRLRQQHNDVRWRKQCQKC